MTEHASLTRRSFLAGAVGLGATALIGCSGSDGGPLVSRSIGDSPEASPIECGPVPAGDTGVALWQTAAERGIVYGSSTATWQLADPQYRKLFSREASILFTEDDLLWYRLRPTPDSELDFSFGDKILSFAERQGMLLFGAHLVWDEGFGDGWTDSDLRSLREDEARTLLFGTLEAEVDRYRGRMAGWIVVNEAVDGFGIRSEVPWYGTIGSSYVEESFRLARETDPEATLVYNDFGYETNDEFNSAVDKRAVTLDFLDELIGAGVPVDALGVQAHLRAGGFAEAFDTDAYRRFLSDVADRGLAIVITEMDVLDDGLPPSIAERDAAVADTVRRYLEAALSVSAVGALMTFGLSDRYTWLQEDYPREDGAPRRPLPFDEDLRPKPAYEALTAALEEAPARNLLWKPPRCGVEG
jgi:endo-1,4-beta-xylanase